MQMELDGERARAGELEAPPPAAGPSENAH